MVHHERYMYGREPWEYPLDNFITFCEYCHDMEHAPGRSELIEGEIYPWKDLTGLLGFEPHGFLTQNAEQTLCGCFRLDYNPDAPDIVLPGDDKFITEQALRFALQLEFVPIFIKAKDGDWEYCGRYRVETATANAKEVEIQRIRASDRKVGISMVLFLEKEQKEQC